MRIALYSDLHLVFHHEHIWEPPALDVDVVILAGDIAHHAEGIEWASGKFLNKRIVYVVGNHEYYGASLLSLPGFRKAAKNAGVDLLENNSVEIDGVRFIGATMWSNFKLYGEGETEAFVMLAAGRSINDFVAIRGRAGKTLVPHDTALMHDETVAFFEAELAQPFDGKTVMVTHFAPHRNTVAPQYAGDKLTPYFVSDMSRMMEKHQIDLWCYGHTHTNSDFFDQSGCRVISNQRGYAREIGCNGFRENLVIEL